MKRNLLAIAIPALLVAGAANASIEVWNKDGNKLNVNGRVYALNYITDTDNSAVKKGGQGDQTTARIGFTGETQVTDVLSGYGRFEHDFYTGKDGNKETRYAFAGLKVKQFGAFDYGRNDGVLKAFTAYTDVLPELGGDSSDNTMYTLSARTKAVATYRNTDFFGLVNGLNFALQYADNGDNSSTQSTGGVTNAGKTAEAYGTSVQWSIFDTGLTIGGGYAWTGSEDNQKTWTGGIKYNANNLYLAGLYIQSDRDAKGTVAKQEYQGYEFVAQYGIDFEVGRLTPSVAYIKHKDKTDGSDVSNAVVLGFFYNFNKNLTAIVDYRINLLDKDDIGAWKKATTANAIDGSTKDTLALGLIYQF